MLDRLFHAPSALIICKAGGTDDRKVLFTQNSNKPPVKSNIPSVQKDSFGSAFLFGGKYSDSQTEFGHGCGHVNYLNVLPTSY